MADFENREDGRVSSTLENGFVLPWGQPLDLQTSATACDVTPGEFVLRTLFSEFTVLAEKKIETILGEPLERPLSKSLQRGEDAQFDQLLNSLHIVAEYSLPSLLKTLFKWYEKQQNKFDDADGQKGKVNITRPKGGSESPKLQSKFHVNKDHLTERRDLAVDFLFCLVLIEVLKQLPVHPVDDEFIQYILSLAFRHFKQRDSIAASPSASNSEIIAALYAEVLGILAHACFLPVRKRFIAEFKEHQNNTSSFVNIIYGMKYLRIKLFPVEELEESFNFMRECATMFIDSRDKEVKHAFALMFVEILLPVAAGANRELNVPALKGFVDMMYHHTFDLTKKTRHSQAIYPLVTVLLCVSQKAFFLGSWPSFLNMCLGTLKQRDVKMQKVAMECLYRLVWVYMVRIKGESNTATVGRLRSITDVLFPRGSRAVVPREAPLNYFVKIIQFISQEKLDFAMHDIIFDLLSIGRTSRQISPERMNIGLRAFFVIADGLQRKSSETPAMPTSTTPLPSGNTVKVRRVASMKNLTEAQASSIGLANYYHSIRKTLDSIIRALDVQVGRPMMMSNPHCSQKEHEEVAAGERKPKVDPKIELFRTCIAAIPRCIPEGMTKMELVDLLCRVTVHMDEELRGLALSSLQSFVLNFSDWRESTILGFINVILREIQDNLPLLLDSALRMLLQLLGQWKTALSAGSGDVQVGQDLQLELSAHNLPNEKEVDRMTVLHGVEGFALVMLCSIHPVIRKLALLVLKEVRILCTLMDLNEKEKAEKVVLDVIDQVFPTVLENVLHSVPQSEKLFSGPLGNVDILVVNERLAGNMDKETGEQLNVSLHSFFWSSLMAGLLNKHYLPELCPSALQFSWPSVFNRLVTVYALIDSGASGIDSITSLSSVYSRGPKKTMNVNHVCLFRNYLIFACCAYPRSPLQRSGSPEQDGGGASLEGSESRGDSRPPSPSMMDSLFRFAVPLLKSDVSDIREAVIIGLGRTSPCSYREFLDELQFLLREGLDRRAESVRRKRKRDVLRAYLVRIFELNAEHGCFSDSASELVTEDGLSPIFVEYIEGTRCYLESESEKDMPAMMQQRLHFAHFLYKMISSVPVSLHRNLLPDDMRCSLFFLFSSWCAHFGVKAYGLQKTPLIPSAQSNDLEMASLYAMCGLLQCGPAFDRNGLITGGYLYNWLQTVLNSPKEKIHQLGRTTLVHLLENNTNIPSLLHWVIDKCYTGARLVVDGCFKALVSVFTKSDYPCDMIPILNVVLFKTADSSLDIREKAAQLLQLLERRFFPFTFPSLSCTSRCAYSQCQRTLSQALASAHPEITTHMFEEMTARFEMASPVGQRCILQYMLPWLSNIELVDVSNCFPSPPEVIIQTDEEAHTGPMSPVKLDGEGWGSLEATQLVLNNLFYITVKYDEQFSKEIEEAWGSLCRRWTNNIREILGYLIVMAGVIGSSEVLVHAKKLAVYVARANQQKAIEELMEELKLTETVASQFERCDEPPYFRPLQKSTSRDSVSDALSGEGTGTLTKKSIAKRETIPKGDMKMEGDAPTKDSKEERKESKEERRETMEERKEKGDSMPRGMESALMPESVKVGETSVPLAEPEEMDQIIEKEKSECSWAQEWVIVAQRLVVAGMTLPLPVPDGEKFFAALPDILPFAPYVASLYRCNFALMLLAELVLDQAIVDWGEHLPLMLHVIFLALDHGKALVYEHSKRLLINLIIVVVCRGNHVSLAQSLFNFITVSEQGLGKHGLLKSSWTLDVGNIVGVAGPSAGARTGTGTGTESVDGNIVSAGAGISETSAGSSSREESLPPEENSANRLVEQIQELIEFLANSDCKPLWAFEDITPRAYEIKSAEQLELFVASVVQIFQASDSGTQVQEKMARVALHWATSCSSRHYAGRSFQVFRALKVPFSWSMLSDVLSRLVESVGDASEDVQGYVMEILLTLEAASDWTIMDPSNTSESKNGQELSLGFYLDDETEDVVDEYKLHIDSAGPLARVRQGGHIRSLSSGCEFKRHSCLFNHFGRPNGSGDEIRTKSVSVQCLLKTPSEAINPQSQADMVTRVFWIAVSLLESDYEHEFLMAIHLLNKILSVLDLSCHESREKLDKVLHRLKWSDFPGLQALLLKGVTNSATSEASLHLLAKLTLFSNVSLVDPSQAAGFALNMLALLPNMFEHFDEPDEFSKICAANFIQVCRGSGNLANLGKLYEMYMEKSYPRPKSTWLDSVCKYIHDSFGHLTRSHITFLLEVLERGPVIYHQVVLGLVCSLMKFGDFSSPSMRHFQNDALKTISKYLKGNLWKESLDILKMAVSHSSHLDTPPPRPASSVWTAHDSSWSAEAMMIKKDLPGRTLDFTFDLSTTPVIGRKITPEFPGELTRENKVLSPVGTVDLSTWRKPHLSQRRTRERIVNVLTTCGHTVGLKQSPSVVFSSSSDLAVEKQGAGQQSSSEEASITEGLSNDSGKDELESQQISVLTNFDFLYDESEDATWGPDYEDRRLSFCSLGGGSLERDLKSNLQTLECLSGSEPDLTPHDSSDDEDELGRSLTSSTLTTTAVTTSVLESSSESSANVTVVAIDRDKCHEQGRESRSPSVDSTDSLPGASDTSNSYKLFAVTEVTLDSRDEAEKLWTEHVASIVKDTTGVIAVNTFSLFSHLYKSTSKKFYSLTRECCNYLAGDKFRHVTQHFSNTLEFLMSRGECPFVCIDTETLNQTKLLERHKFNVLELDSHFANYVHRSERTMECLDDVKFALKRSSVGSHLDEAETRITVEPEKQELRQVQLCRCMYKTHFQFLLLCSAYARLLESLVQAAHEAKVNDLSQEVNEVRREVFSIMENPLKGDTSSPLSDMEDDSPSKETAEQLLVDKLAGKQIKSSIHLLRTFREKFGGEAFGASDEDNMDCLMSLFCKHMAEKNVGSLVMSGPLSSFASLCRDLMEVNVTILETVEDLSP